MNKKSNLKPYWTFWVIAVAGLLFNLAGCMNYVAQMNAEMLAEMPEAVRMIVANRPAWGTAAFAIAVFGGAIGCVVLLLRKSIAVYVFIVSVFATLVAQVPFIGMEGFPVSAWMGWLSQLVAGAFLIWFSRYAARRDWLS